MPELSFDQLLNNLQLYKIQFEEVADQFNENSNYLPPTFIENRLKFSSSLKNRKGIKGFEKANKYIDESNTFDPFSIDNLIYLNSIICEIQQTQLRNRDVFIGKFKGHPYKNLKTEFTKELLRLKCEFEKLANAYDFFLFLAEYASVLITLHPFADGNGRTTSLILDHFLVQYGYLPQNFDSKLDFMFGKFSELNHPPTNIQIATQIILNVTKSYKAFI